MEKFVQEKYMRPWGYYINIAQGDGYLSKILHVNSGAKLSVQSHNCRSEHWFVLKGEADVLLGENEITLSSGQSLDIPLKAIHSVGNSKNSDLEILEIQTGEVLSEDDIVRYKDIYGRV